jgi:hypothetical protein
MENGRMNRTIEGIKRQPRGAGLLPNVPKPTISYTLLHRTRAERFLKYD